MKLQGKLKQREDLEEQNIVLLQQVNEYRSKFLETQKKNAK